MTVRPSVGLFISDDLVEKCKIVRFRYFLCKFVWEREEVEGEG